jgi:hypothetical protein
MILMRRCPVFVRVKLSRTNNNMVELQFVIYIAMFSASLQLFKIPVFTGVHLSRTKNNMRKLLFKII